MPNFQDLLFTLKQSVGSFKTWFLTAGIPVSNFQQCHIKRYVEQLFLIQLC